MPKDSPRFTKGSAREQKLSAAMRRLKADPNAVKRLFAPRKSNPEKNIPDD